MNEKKKGLLLGTTRQMNMGAGVSGIGFLLYIAASALGWKAVADAVTILFGIVSLYVFASVAAGRKQDKEAVSYNLLWGQGALTILLAGCAVLTIKQRLGL